MSQAQAEYLYRITGADSLAEAITAIETERQIMRDLKDTNTALRIYNRRLRLIIILAEKTFVMIEQQGSLFLPPEVMKIIGDVRKQIDLAQRAITQSAELCEEIHAP